MASNKVLITKSHLTNIGNAIREKTNTSGTILLTEMPDKIRSIKTGSTTKPVIRSLSITSNGTYNAPTGVDGYNPITVNVPQTVGDLHLEVEPVSSLFSARRIETDPSEDELYIKYQQQLLDMVINNSRENIIFTPTKSRKLCYFLAGVSTDYNFNDSQILKLNYIGEDGIVLAGLYAYTPNITLPKIKILDNYILDTSGIFKSSKKEYIEDIFLDSSIRLSNHIGSSGLQEGSYVYSGGSQFSDCRAKEIDSNLLYKLFNKSVCVDDLTSDIYKSSFSGCSRLKHINNLGIYNASRLDTTSMFNSNFSLNTFTFTRNANAIWSGSTINIANACAVGSLEQWATTHTITTDFEEFMNKVDNEDILYHKTTESTTCIMGKYSLDIEAIKDTLYSLPDCSEGSEVNTIILPNELEDSIYMSSCVELQDAIAAAVSKNWTVS